MFLELMSDWLADTVRSVTEAVAQGQAAQQDPLTRLSRLLVEIADKKPELAQLQAEFWLYAVRNPSAMDALAERTRQQIDALEKLVAPVMTRLGVSPGVSPTAVTTLLVGLSQGLIRLRRIDQGAVPDHLMAEGIRWLFTGILARQDPMPAGTSQRRNGEDA
jgi:AcrR family transcriptional regulator